MPADTTIVAAILVRPNGSRNTSVPRMAPKITLVSRSAAIGASAPRVCAHSTSPYASTLSAPASQPPPSVPTALAKAEIAP